MTLYYYLKKLPTFLLFSFLVGNLSSRSYAKIIYTDVNPDTTIAGGFGSFPLDLDNNSNSDYIIWLITPSDVTIISPDSNEVLGAYISMNLLPYALNLNDTIDSTQTDWNDNNGGHMQLSPGGSGQWNGVTDRYLGLRFYIGNDIHYGWVRLDVSSAGTQFTVKDYAYEDVKEKGILAGATTFTNVSGVSPLIQHALFTQLENKLLITIPSNEQLIEVRLFNIYGRLLLAQNLSSNVITMPAIQRGMYLIHLQTSNSIFTEKIILH